MFYIFWRGSILIVLRFFCQNYHILFVFVDCKSTETINNKTTEPIKQQNQLKPKNNKDQSRSQHFATKLCFSFDSCNALIWCASLRLELFSQRAAKWHANSNFVKKLKVDHTHNPTRPHPCLFCFYVCFVCFYVCFLCVFLITQDPRLNIYC